MIDLLPLRIGILGASNITRKNTLAICASKECDLVAIASRSHSKAFQLLQEFMTTKRAGQEQSSDDHFINVRIFAGDNDLNDGLDIPCYQRLIDCPDIDAVYVPLPTSFHLVWVKAALKAGKHVLVEKPVALSTSDYEEMIQVSKQTQKYIMDGTMFVHHPRTSQILNFITQNNSTFGDVVRLYSEFTFLGDEEFFNHNVRIKSKELFGDPLGCIGDLGWYCVRMALLIFKYTQNTSPKSVQVVHFILNEHNVPIDATCIVTFQNSSTLTFHCSFLQPLTQTITIYGRKETIFMDDFVIPKQGQHSFYLQSQSLSHAHTHSIHQKQEITSDDDNDKIPQEVSMWNNFGLFCRAYDKQENVEEAKSLLQMSLLNQRIMDSLIESMQHESKIVEIS